mgnify:CR=1 FL=1
MSDGRRTGLVALVTTAVVAAWCVRPLWDVDVFWHVATGRAILTGGLPTTDIFSAADPTAPWATFQWLYQVAVAGIEGAAGLGGVRAVHVGVIALAVGGWTAVVARRAGLLAGVVSGAFLLLLFEDRVRVRPHVFELAFSLSLALLLRRGERGPAELGAIALAALWANLHAVSALWWLALVGAWVVHRREWRAVAIWLAGFAAILSAPGSWDGLSHALTSHSDWPAEFVPELASTWTYAGQGWWGMVVLAGVAVGLAAAADLGRRRSPLVVVLLAAGTAVAACLLARWVWFGAIPVGLWLLEVRPRRVGPQIALMVACLLALGVRSGARWSPAERAAVVEDWRWPDAACAFMDEVGLRAPLDTTGAWSGYALYRLHPGGRVLADGRLVFGPEVADLLRRRSAGDVGTFDEAVGRFRLHSLLWPAGSVPPRDPTRWWRVYADDVAEVWVPSPVWSPELIAAVGAARAARGLEPVPPPR